MNEITDPQQAPVNAGEPIVPMVIADLEARREFGRKKYGDELRVRNGRDALIDAYQEALDLVICLRQRIEQEKVTRETAQEAKGKIRSNVRIPLYLGQPGVTEVPTSEMRGKHS
ncbi:MAG: hypothetical protein WC683_04355 [bacterium]